LRIACEAWTGAAAVKYWGVHACANAVSGCLEGSVPITHRRQLITALGASVLAKGLTFTPGASAQQAAPGGPGKVWRVGVVPGGLFAPRKYQWDVFFSQMQALGYIEGRNVQYEVRAPAAEGAPFDDPISALLALNVDVIVATGNKAGAAAKRLTQSVPIVLSPATDAVDQGLVASLSRPGGNVTGISIQMEESTGKRMQLLREMVPKTKRMGILWNANTRRQLEAAQEAARQLGIQLLPIEVTSPESIPAAFDAAAKDRAEALVVTMDPFFFGQSKAIGSLALKFRLPSIHALAVGATGGGLMSYGPSDTDYYRIAALYADKILRGARPADLPIQQPTKWELVINMQTAKALAITVPKILLVQAERVID
jgi:putative ABC transport system substrate-binding protein